MSERIIPIRAPVPIAHNVQQPLGERIRQMQAEARALAMEHVEQFRAALETAARLAGEIAEGGEAYLPGCREVARQVAEQAPMAANTLQAIAGRVGR